MPEFDVTTPLRHSTIRKYDQKDVKFIRGADAEKGTVVNVPKEWQEKFGAAQITIPSASAAAKMQEMFALMDEGIPVPVKITVED
ncbi:MAG: hypothetical protein ACAI44_00210 [Candidatus Sericytochromatia bacterium]